MSFSKRFTRRPGFGRTASRGCRWSAPCLAARSRSRLTTPRTRWWMALRLSRVRSISAPTRIHSTGPCWGGLPILAGVPSSRPMPCGFWPRERRDCRRTGLSDVSHSHAGASSGPAGEKVRIRSPAALRCRADPLLAGRFDWPCIPFRSSWLHDSSHPRSLNPPGSQAEAWEPGRRDRFPVVEQAV